MKLTFALYQQVTRQTPQKVRIYVSNLVYSHRLMSFPKSIPVYRLRQNDVRIKSVKTEVQCGTNAWRNYLRQLLFIQNGPKYTVAQKSVIRKKVSKKVLN